MTTQKQEPVTKLFWHPGFGFIMDMTDAGRKLPQGAYDLYTTPPQRKPLTDEEIERLIFRSGGHKSTQNLMSNPMQVREYVELWNERIYRFARAIEAAHGIKE